MTCFVFITLSYFYIHTRWVPLHRIPHVVSTVALNGQTPLQSMFRKYNCSFAKKAKYDDILALYQFIYIYRKGLAAIKYPAFVDQTILIQTLFHYIYRQAFFP